MYRLSSFALLLALIVLSILMPAASHAQAKDFASRDVDIFVTAAYLLPSDNIAADDYGITLHQDGALFGRIGADMWLIPKLSMGVYMNIGSVKVSGKWPFPTSSESVTMLEFGGSLKGRFIFAHGTMAIKAGVNVGYRSFASDLKYADKVNGFSIGPEIDLQFGLGSIVAPHVEFGFLSQPAGGNNDYTSITFPPIIYLGAGCSLGL